MKGVFRQYPAQPHVPLRRRLLDGTSTYAAPVPAEPAAPDPGSVLGVVREQLSAAGAAVVRLERPLTNAEFLVLGAGLGEPQPERAATVRSRVEERVILNLVTTHPATDDPDLQPFGANHLSLHTESSAAAPVAQPRFITLMCLAPGTGTAAQTVLVSMAAVAGALSPDDRAVLSATRYADREGVPMLLREEDGRPVFSVRDFQDEPLHWEHVGNAGPADVDTALTRLYAAMYAGPAHGITWTPGLLVVIDNRRHFHGRTAGRPPGPGSERHLKRLRIAMPAQPAARDPETLSARTPLEAP